MSTKANPSKVSDCYANAEPNEPMFVLLARDQSAPQLVELWAGRRLALGEDPRKVREALECAKNMRRHRHAKKGAPTCEYCESNSNVGCTEVTTKLVTEDNIVWHHWCGSEESYLHSEAHVQTIGEYFATEGISNEYCGDEALQVFHDTKAMRARANAAVMGDESDKFSMTLVLSFDDEDLPDADVICLDLASLNDIIKVSDWLARNANDIRSSGRLIMLATGESSVDFSRIRRYVDGVFDRPASDSIDDWMDKTMPLWLAIRHPERVDILSPELTQGGVSAEEFAETLRQAATDEEELPDYGGGMSGG